MYKMLHTLTMLALLTFLSLPAYAGVSDFFPGDWGLPPEEIRAFYSEEPAEWTHKITKNPSLVNRYPYEYADLNEPTRIFYNFDANTRELRSVSIPLTFWRVKPAEIAAIVDPLRARLADAMDAGPPAEYGEGQTLMGTQVYMWHNNVSLVWLSFTYTENPGTLRCKMDFLSVTQPLDPDLVALEIQRLRDFTNK